MFTHSLSIEEVNSEDKKNIIEHSKYLKKGNNKDYFMIV